MKRMCRLSDVQAPQQACQDVPGALPWPMPWEEWSLMAKGRVERGKGPPYSSILQPVDRRPWRQKMYSLFAQSETGRGTKWGHNAETIHHRPLEGRRAGTKSKEMWDYGR